MEAIQVEGSRVCGMPGAGEGVALPPVAGFVGVSLVDYPGGVASVLFLRGCSFRCPYCYNRALVLPECYHQAPLLDAGGVLAKLEERRAFVDAVVVTGGEPTIHPGLPRLLERVKSLGLLVKLDTNGSNPEMLGMLLREGLVDMVAMDVKAPPTLYPRLTGGVEWDVVKPSVQMLLDGAVPYEFRTTLVPGLVEKREVLGIATVIHGARLYAIQNFRPEGTIDPALEGCYPFRRSEMDGIAAEVSPLVEKVIVRYGA